MSDKIETGGTAFPCLDSHGMGYEGMTLRDYFAAKVLPAIYQDAMTEAGQGSGLLRLEDWRVGLAQDAYAMADAMLEARKK
jgi:hypothetical protein